LDRTRIWEALTESRRIGQPTDYQIIFYTQTELVSVARDSGVVLWRYPVESSSMPSPIVSGETVFFCHSAGAEALSITQSGEDFGVSRLWATNGAYSYFATPVCYQDHLYGFLEPGYVKCLELKTGKTKWSVEMPDCTYGGIIRVGEHLLILADDGTLTLADASPAGYAERAHFRALNSGLCYNHPVVCDGRIYLRSIQEALCLDAVALTLVPLKWNVQVNGSSVRLPQLQLGSANGTGLLPERARTIGILTTTDLSVPVGHWARLTNPLLTNGVLILEGWERAPGAQRFFLAVEPP